MSTKEALDAYDDCSAKIFARGNRKVWSLSERFRSKALRKVIEDIVEKRGMGEELLDPKEPEKGKVFVCVVPSNDLTKTEVIRSFRTDIYHPWDEHVKIWEAARATTAASSYFKPQELGSGPTPQTYIDAAIRANNPVYHLRREAAAEFGSARRLGCLVSIGTGTREIQLSGIRGFIRAPSYYWQLAGALKNQVTDCEAAHRELESTLSAFPGAYFRFNVPRMAETVGLSHYKKIPAIKSSTCQYLAKNDVSMRVRQAAEALKTEAFDCGLTLGHISGKKPTSSLPPHDR